jgi:predicted small metal-binding protein
MRHFIRYAEEYGSWLLHRDLGDGRVNIITQLTDDDLIRITKDFKTFRYKKERYREEIEEYIRVEEAHLAHIQHVFGTETELSQRMTENIKSRIDYYKMLLTGGNDGLIQTEGYEDSIRAGFDNVDPESCE